MVGCPYRPANRDAKQTTPVRMPDFVLSGSFGMAETAHPKESAVSEAVAVTARHAPSLLPKSTPTMNRMTRTATVKHAKFTSQQANSVAAMARPWLRPDTARRAPRADAFGRIRCTATSPTLPPNRAAIPMSAK